MFVQTPKRAKNSIETEVCQKQTGEDEKMYIRRQENSHIVFSEIFDHDEFLEGCESGVPVSVHFALGRRRVVRIVVGQFAITVPIFRIHINLGGERRDFDHYSTNY